MKHHRVLGLIGVFSLGFSYGCGPGDPEAPAVNGPAGAGASAGSGSSAGKAGTGGGDTGGFAGASGTGGVGGAGGSSGPGGSAGSAGSTGAGCTASGATDVPDEDFVDSNCDGIDGEAADAIFVAPDGRDEAEGTMDEPVKTLNRAVQIATQSNNPIYVCNGTYSETLLIRNSVAIYGGYDCARGWKRIKDRAVVEAKGIAPLIISNAKGNVHLERIAFHASVETTPGASSQAGAIFGSDDVELVRVEFVTADAVAGNPGTPGISGNDPPTIVGANGESTATVMCPSPNHSTACARYATGGFNVDAVLRCSAGAPYASRGGPGGRGGNARLASGTACMKAETADPGGEGSAGEILRGTQWTPVAPADLGRSGQNGTDGFSAASGLGSLDGALYFASNGGESGTDGAHGMPGKGGHGGYSGGGGGDVCSTAYVTGSGGGQAGSGGCAGTRASGGGAGGGSIGLVIVNSTVDLAFPHFEVGDGGAGGDGALGGQGKPGIRIGGPGVSYLVETGYYVGKAGQIGGKGGDGGDGGAGAGGPSIAILYTGAPPKVSDADYTIGLPGAGGLSQSLGNAPAGVTGEAVNLDSPAP